MHRIPDPSAAKPEDWDEDAPVSIEDEEAEKPEGWLDDEPAEVADPGKQMGIAEKDPLAFSLHCLLLLALPPSSEQSWGEPLCTSHQPHRFG